MHFDVLCIVSYLLLFSLWVENLQRNRIALIEFPKKQATRTGTNGMQISKEKKEISQVNPDILHFPTQHVLVYCGMTDATPQLNLIGHRIVWIYSSWKTSTPLQLSPNNSFYCISGPPFHQKILKVGRHHQTD